MKTAQVIQPCQVRVRHVKIGSSTDPGAVQVFGVWFAPQDPQGVNGDHGWTSGSYQPSLGEEGTAKLTFPNTVGEDGILHRRRFTIARERGAYHVGDEWLEVRRTVGPGLAGDLLGVFTPSDANVSRTAVDLQLVDALWLLTKQRETPAGAWTGHAPRDVFEHYTQAWAPVLFDDFTPTGRFTTSTSYQETADEQWGYIRATEQPDGTVRLIPGAAAPAYLRAKPRLTAQADWRVETTIVVQEDPATDQIGAYVEVYDYVNGLSLGRIGASYITTAGTSYLAADAWTSTAATARRVMPCPGRPEVKIGLQLSLAIERRGRWTFFYMQDQLACVLPSAADETDALPQIEIAANAGSLTFDVLNVNARELRPFLNRSAVRGDARLPGQLTTGGLVGSYYNDADLATLDTVGTPLPLHLIQLEPTRGPDNGLVERRLDPSFAALDPPASIPATNWSARWVGAIYLDLDSHDYAIRTQCDDRARVWIADTRWGEQIINDWTTGHTTTTTTGAWLKAGSSAGSAPAGAAGILTGERSGWFPIVIEYGQAGGGQALAVEIQRSGAVGTWTALGAGTAGEKLSPLGCYQGTARLDSHYEQLLALRDTYGLQFTVLPKSLESGEFPGRLVPRVREGRDTDYVLDADESVDIQTAIDARETCSTLLLDAQGIADPSGAGQLTKEAIDYTAVQPGAHLLLATEYDSLSDITIPEVAEQRAAALLLLKGTPWEEVTAKPLGYRDLTDTFPLTGAAALFAWSPGDGVRLDLEHLDIRDASCRQIISPSWPITPDGIGRPDVRFRQRPRGFTHLIRKIIRDQRTPQRTYQRQLTSVQGSIGSVNSAAGADVLSRVALPAIFSAVVKCTLIVIHKPDSTDGTIELNGVATPVEVESPGRYDLTPWIERGVSQQSMTAEITGLDTDECEYQLELQILI